MFCQDLPQCCAIKNRDINKSEWRKEAFTFLAWMANLLGIKAKKVSKGILSYEQSKLVKTNKCVCYKTGFNITGVAYVLNMYLGIKKEEKNCFL